MERKFRAISKASGEFVYGNLINGEFISSFDNPEHFIKIKSQSIAQYIGFKDKNQTEIYEGHILYNKEEMTAIKIEFNNFLVKTEYGTDEGVLIPACMFDFTRYEVVAFSNELLD